MRNMLTIACKVSRPQTYMHNGARSHCSPTSKYVSTTLTKMGECSVQLPIPTLPIQLSHIISCSSYVHVHTHIVNVHIVTKPAYTCTYVATVGTVYVSCPTSDSWFCSISIIYPGGARGGIARSCCRTRLISVLRGGTTFTVRGGWNVRPTWRRDMAA